MRSYGNYTIEFPSGQGSLGRSVTVPMHEDGWNLLSKENTDPGKGSSGLLP